MINVSAPRRQAVQDDTAIATRLLSPIFLRHFPRHYVAGGSVRMGLVEITLGSLVTCTR